MYRSPPRSRQFFLESLVVRGRGKSYQKLYFLTTYISMINLLLCTVLPPGAFEVDQTRKFDDFLDLIQFFQI